MDPKNLSISDFSYNLPAERVAKYPLEERDKSRLIIYQNGEINTSFYRNIDEFVPAESLMVFNNTKVVEARLLFQKPTGGVIEIFCLEPEDKYTDVSTAMLQKGKVTWKCLIGGASKWKHGMVLTQIVRIVKGEVVLKAAIVDRLPDCFAVQLTWEPEELSFVEILHLAGFIPLPPYLHRDAEEEDKSRYQTIYAKLEGSVAAPTAGLHFTNTIFEKLKAKNIQNEYVTLHVGAGTFKPVQAEKLDQHEMHAEFMEVSVFALDNLVNYLDKTIVAVGTTSLRTLETLYWMGVKVIRRPQAELDQLAVRQWDPYEIEHNNISAKHALASLQKWMKKVNMERLIIKTQIFIAPGYSLKVAKGLVTNFHQPRSTLLLLVAAIVGNDWKKIYDYALENDFRFLSYGDGCLLWASGKSMADDTHGALTR